jgi:hypothetical protein
MRPSTTRARHGRSIVGKIVLALAFASVMVGVSMGPALSDDNERRDRQQERYRRAHQPYRRAHQPYRRAPQPYRYYAPPPVIYAPPPVVYAPPPSPGISLFFELPFRYR